MLKSNKIAQFFLAFPEQRLRVYHLFNKKIIFEKGEKMSKASNNTYLAPGEPLSDISLRLATQGAFDGVTVNAQTAKKPSDRHLRLVNLDKALEDFYARENYSPSTHR